MNVINTFSDSSFVTYICSNHMKLFNDEILKSEENELKKYIQSLFSTYKKISNKVTKKIQDDESQDISEILVVVKDDSDYINAIKEVLWQLNNTPSTAKKILMHIGKLNSEGQIVNITKEDYPITNKAFSFACWNELLKLEKIPGKNGKTVYLYKNPTDKRKGFYYEGKLLSLNQLSQINNVPIVTIRKRLDRGMKIEFAIK